MNHNYESGKFMTQKATQIGGIFTFFFLCAAGYIIVQTALNFAYDNIIETKAQIPIVVVAENWS